MQYYTTSGSTVDALGSSLGHLIAPGFHNKLVFFFCVKLSFGFSFLSSKTCLGILAILNCPKVYICVHGAM